MLALLAATFFRTLPLLDNRFHPDEALYATFARLISSGQSVLLSDLVVDKPPLAFYLGALSSLLVGGGELGMRLPNLYASVVSVALTWAFAGRLYTRRVAHVAAWALALSPFAILFSITVFLDPLLTAFCLWGLWMTAAGRYRWGAAAFALAFAVKQTALLFAPLALALSLLGLPSDAGWRDALRRVWRAAFPLLIALALTTLLIIVWDAVRQPPIGFWDQGYSDNMPGRFIRANEIAPRARAWLDLLHYTSATPALNVVFVVGAPLLWLFNLRRPSRAALADVILAGYLLLFLAAYWLLAFNVWDRYLTPLLPLLALLFARIADGRFAWRIARRLFAFLNLESWNLNLSSVFSFLLPLSFLLLLLPAAFRAAHSGYPIGGDHGAYDGIDDVARFVRTLPPEGVLYDHWLSWEFNYYLFDRPLYVSWFPTPEALTTDLRAFGHTSPRYFVVPSWEADTEIRAAAAHAGFEFVPLHITARRDGSASFTVYRLAPLAP
jgi:4-amino-4-deoxy-L-arabinose transferase-like glycosyltransferase